jgi:hypothetical protein
MLTVVTSQRQFVRCSEAVAVKAFLVEKTRRGVDIDKAPIDSGTNKGETLLVLFKRND